MPFVHADTTYFDEDGVVRYNAKVRRERAVELKKVAEADAESQVEAWYVVSASWMQAWLAFADGNTYKDQSSPSPGPVWNKELLVQQGENDWRPRPELIPQSSDRKTGPNSGHYRRVNNHVWHTLTQLYPGSGPAIICDNAKPDDISLWQVILHQTDNASQAPQTMPTQQQQRHSIDSTSGDIELQGTNPGTLNPIRSHAASIPPGASAE